MKKEKKKKREKSDKNNINYQLCASLGTNHYRHTEYPISGGAVSFMEYFHVFYCFVFLGQHIYIEILSVTKNKQHRDHSSKAEPYIPGRIISVKIFIFTLSYNPVEIELCWQYFLLKRLACNLPLASASMSDILIIKWNKVWKTETLLPLKK